MEKLNNLTGGQDATTALDDLINEVSNGCEYHNGSSDVGWALRYCLMELKKIRAIVAKP